MSDEAKTAEAKTSPTVVASPMEVVAETNGKMTFNDVEPTEVEVEIAGKQYILREASGGAAVAYRNALIEATRLGPQGKPVSLKGIANAEPLLVSLCLFGEKNRGVSIAVIQSWPARIQKALFDRAKEISELGDEEDTEQSLLEQREDIDKRLADITPRTPAGNEQSDTGGGFD